MPTTNPDWSNFQVFNEKVLVGILCFYCCQAWILILNSFILQTYSPIPPHGFLASSPQAHPYMWGVQVFVTYIMISQLNLIGTIIQKLEYVSSELSQKSDGIWLNFLCCYHYRCFCYCQYFNCYTSAVAQWQKIYLLLFLDRI